MVDAFVGGIKSGLVLAAAFFMGQDEVVVSTARALRASPTAAPY